MKMNKIEQLNEFCENGDLESIESMDKKGLTSWVKYQRKCPIFYAYENGHVDVVEYLIKENIFKDFLYDEGGYHLFYDIVKFPSLGDNSRKRIVSSLNRDKVYFYSWDDNKISSYSNVKYFNDYPRIDNVRIPISSESDKDSSESDESVVSQRSCHSRRSIPPRSRKQSPASRCSSPISSPRRARKTRPISPVSRASSCRRTRSPISRKQSPISSPRRARKTRPVSQNSEPELTINCSKENKSDIYTELEQCKLIEKINLFLDKNYCNVTSFKSTFEEKLEEFKKDFTDIKDGTSMHTIELFDKIYKEYNKFNNREEFDFESIENEVEECCKHKLTIDFIKYNDTIFIAVYIDDVKVHRVGLRDEDFSKGSLLKEHKVFSLLTKENIKTIFNTDETKIIKLYENKHDMKSSLENNKVKLEFDGIILHCDKDKYETKSYGLKVLTQGFKLILKNKKKYSSRRF